MARELTIGSDTWPGVLKVIEECGELIDAMAKLGTFPDNDHPTNMDVVEAVVSEMADVEATLQFFWEANGKKLTPLAEVHQERYSKKLNIFRKWQDENGE